MAAGFICGISIAVYGKPWTLWLLFFGILLWSAIVTGPVSYTHLTLPTKA